MPISGTRLPERYPKSWVNFVSSPFEAVIAEAGPAWQETAAEPIRLATRCGDVARTARRLA